jgi:hypothetical protein
LSEIVKDQIYDRADRSRPRRSYPPLLADAADLLVDDVLRLLFHRDLIPRSVFVDYLKILFAFHLALYHLRIIKQLPRLASGQPAAEDFGLFLDAVGTTDSATARLAQRSAYVWFARIPEFVRATFIVKKLDEFARYLERRRKLRVAPDGVRPVGDLIPLLGSTYRVERNGFANSRLATILDESADVPSDRETEIDQILQLGLDDFATYVEIVTAYRIDFHRKYLTECLDSLLLKNRAGAMIAQPRRGDRRFVLDARLLEVLLQISLLRPGGVRHFHTAALRIDEFLAILRQRYGLYIDRMPAGDGFAPPSISDHAALSANRTAFVAKLREIGFYTDLSDAYLTQTIIPRYVVGVDGTAR